MLHDPGPTLVLVGGFLGAGKTSLIVRAAALLSEQGIRAAAITNDQAADLVDTQWSETAGIHTAEVAGGCFCCRFSEFVNQTEALLAYSPDVIFAEPVGSCTDLSATVLEPLRTLYTGRFRVAPLTVLVDPARITSLFDGPGDVSYLFRKQIEEADIVCFTKADLGHSISSLPVISPRQVSAKTGEGVLAWLDEVLSGETRPSGRLLQIDYQRYAKAEAALGWLNATVELTLQDPASPAMVVGPLLDTLDRALTESQLEIAHLKIFDRSPVGTLKAAICSNGDEPEIEGDLAASAAENHLLTINMRVQAEPDILVRTLKKCLKRWLGQYSLLACRAFRPAAPRPEYRFSGPQPLEPDSASGQNNLS